MENKVTDKEYVDKNYVHKNEVKKLKEKVHKELDNTAIKRVYQLIIDDYFDEVLEDK